MSAKFELSANAGNTLKVIEQMTGLLNATGKAAEGAAAASKKLSADAQRIRESLDPQEKLNRKYDEMRQMLAAGIITQNQMIAKGIEMRQVMHAASAEGKAQAAAEIQATKAKEQAALQAAATVKRNADNQTKSLQNITEGMRRAAAAQKAVDDAAAAGAAKVKKDREAATAQLQKEREQLAAAGQKVREWLDPQEKLNAKYRELGVLVKSGQLSIDEATKAGVKYRQEMMGAADASDKAFGVGMASSLAGMVGGYLSISSAISTVTAAMQSVAEERKKAAEESYRARMGLGSLSQLAATEKDPTKREALHANLLSEARGIQSSGAAETEGEAGTLLFEMVSAGLDKADREFATQLRAKGTLFNVAGAAKAYDSMKTELGQGEVGSFRQFMSKALAGAAVAPGSFEQLPIAASGAGSSAKALGLGDEFLTAATAVAGKARGNVDEGGTQVAAFLKQVEKSDLKGLEGLTGVEIVEKIAALPEKQQGYGGVLGDRAEAVDGFRVLRDNIEMVRSLENDIRAAQDSDLASNAVNLNDKDARQAAANMRAVAQGQLAQSQSEQASEAENIASVLRAERMKQAVDTGGWWAPVRESISNAVGEFTAEGEIRKASENITIQRFAGRDSPYSADATAKVEDYMRRQAESLERIDRRSGSKVTTQQE